MKIQIGFLVTLTIFYLLFDNEVKKRVLKINLEDLKK